MARIDILFDFIFTNVAKFSVWHVLSTTKGSLNPSGFAVALALLEGGYLLFGCI